MEKHLRTATFLTRLLDNQFNIFGFRFGLNGIVGILPISGDLLVALVSFYLVWVGLKMDIPKEKIIEMIGNIVINFIIGLLPVLGDLADFFHKANVKNLRILKEYAHQSGRVIEGEVLESK